MSDKMERACGIIVMLSVSTMMVVLSVGAVALLCVAFWNGCAQW